MASSAFISISADMHSHTYQYVSNLVPYDSEQSGSALRTLVVWVWVGHVVFSSLNDFVTLVNLLQGLRPIELVPFSFWRCSSGQVVLSF
jgi:hypothetical protein